MIPYFITVVVTIEPGCETAVLPLVREMGNPPIGGLSAAIAALGIVHFMSINVIPADAGPAHLVMEISADQAASLTLNALAGPLGPALDGILAAAGIAAARRTDLGTFLLRHHRTLGTSWLSTMRRAGALGLPFCGSPGLTVERILDEDKLARRIARMHHHLHGPKPARDKLRAVREDLWRAGDAKWAFVPADAPFLEPDRPCTLGINARILGNAFPALLWPLVLIPLAVWFMAYLLGWTHSVLLAPAAVLLTIAAAALVVYLRLVKAEATDVPADVAPDPDDVAKIMAEENKGALNLLVVVTRMKPGWLRSLTARGVMWLTSQTLALSGRPGFLGNVHVVHYARWILLPGTGQLVFCSNYDGSFENYLEDFINLVPLGTTSIWSNCQGFPKTRLLFFEGTADGDRFRRWVRCQQIPTAFWYAAYPDLTLERMSINAQIRQGIAAAETDQQAKAWLALFGAPSP